MTKKTSVKVITETKKPNQQPSKFSIYETIEAKTQLSEQLKTKEQNDQQTKFYNFAKEKLGDLHPFEYKIVDVISEKMGLVNAIIDKYSDFTIGGKMYITGDEDAVKLLETRMKEAAFKPKLKPWFKEALKKGSGYLEIADMFDLTMIPSTKVVSSDTMYVLKDEFGNIIRFNQYLGDPSVPNPDKIIPLTTDEILQLNINSSGNKSYGLGIIYPALETINNFGEAQRALHKIVKRKANSPLHAALGNAEKEDYPEQSDIDNFGSKLTYMNETTEWVTGPNVKFEVINFGDIGEKFMTILDNDYKLMSYCFQVPELLLGSDRGFTGSSNVQMDAFIKRCQSYKEEITSILREHVFDKLLELNGIKDAEYEICFDTETEEDRNKKVSGLKDLLSVATLSPQLRIELEKKLAGLLNIEYDEEYMPKVDPFQPKQKEPAPAEKPEEVLKQISTEEKSNDLKQIEKIKEFLKSKKAPQELEEAYSKEASNYKLEEWLRFDLRSSKQEILEAIAADNFADLAAQNRKEIYMGKLTKGQIEKLRETLYDAVNEGKTINQIAEDINKKLKLRDRYILGEDGKKILQITKENRGKQIAQSEVTRLGNEGNLISLENKDVKEVVYVSEDTACEICSPSNGKVYNISEAYGEIPRHPNCRCRFDKK